MIDPRICSVPPSTSSLGGEAVELARSAGLELDDWQAFVLERSLGLRDDGAWSAFEVGVCVARQNGKGAILEARELVGLFLIRERLIIHTAHLFDTSQEAFRRLCDLIEANPDLEREVRRISRSHGSEGIELKTGQRIRFRARTKGGGRGFSGDLVILDEAMYLPEMSHGALLPTVSARPNPQVWYAGTAVDQQVQDDGRVFARVRARAMAGGDPALAYFEWSADVGSRAFVPKGRDQEPEDVTDEVSADRGAWREANPALGIRITEEHIANEHLSMDRRTFAVEREGVGDWPDVSGAAETVIPLETWRALRDRESAAVGGLCLAFDVRPDRSWSAVAAAGVREDGLAQLEVLAHERGTGWVVKWLAEFVEAEKPLSVVCDGGSPAASLLVDLDRAGVKVETLSATEYAQACGQLFDLVDQKAGRHRGQPELDAAVRGAAKRPLGEAWAWSRKGSADITPLVAVTLAWFGYASREPAPPPPMIAFA